MIQNTVLEDIGSDHRPTLIQVTYNMVAPHRSRMWRWNYIKSIWRRYRDLSDACLQSLPSGKDVNKKYGGLCGVITSAVKQSIQRAHRLMYKPYWTAELAELVKKRNMARQTVERAPTTDNKANYNKLTVQVKLLLSKAKPTSGEGRAMNLIGERKVIYMETPAQHRRRNSKAKTAATQNV